MAIVYHRQVPSSNDMPTIRKSPCERMARGWRPSLRLLKTTSIRYVCIEMARGWWPSLRLLKTTR